MGPHLRGHKVVPTQRVPQAQGWRSPRKVEPAQKRLREIEREWVCPSEEHGQPKEFQKDSAGFRERERERDKRKRERERDGGGANTKTSSTSGCLKEK